MGPEAAARQLEVLGYAFPDRALNHLRALTSGGTRRGRIQALLLPTLLDWLGDTPDPDRGLLAYRTLSESLTDQQWFLRALRDEGAVAQRLMIVLGGSTYLSSLLTNAPEVIRQYADGPRGPMLLDQKPADVARAILNAAGRYDESAASGRGGALAAPARTRPGRVRGPARVPGRAAGVRGALVGVGRGARGAARVDDFREGTGDRPPGTGAVRGDRDGPARRRGTRLRLRRRRAVRVRSERGRGRVEGGALGDRHRGGDAAAAGRAEPGPAARDRREPAPRGAAGTAGAHPRLLPGVLRAVGAVVGRCRHCCGRTRLPATSSSASTSCT